MNSEGKPGRMLFENCLHSSDGWCMKCAKARCADLEIENMELFSKVRAAEVMAAAIDRTIYMRALDARSAIADARNNFGEPYSRKQAQEIIEKRLYPHKL